MTASAYKRPFAEPKGVFRNAIGEIFLLGITAHVGEGLDVYGARCALLHAFSAHANFHEQNPDAKKFGYHDGGRHAYDPAVNEHLVIVGTASFLNDVVHAVTTFMQACRDDAELRQRVEARLPRVLATFSFPAE